jgi:hypothetical protein
VTLPGIVASILPPRWRMLTRANASHFAKKNPAIAVVPAKSLDFQLVQSGIELAWGLIKLADGLKAEKRERDARVAVQRAIGTLLKAERHVDELVGPEGAAASSSLQLLRECLQPRELADFPS